MDGERRETASTGRSDEGYPSALKGTDPAEILSRIVEGDPLRIVEAAERRIVEQAWLLDPRRLAGRTLARMAFETALIAERTRPYDEWKLRCLDRSIDDLIEEDRSMDLACEPLFGAASHEFYEVLARGMQIEPAYALRLSVILNSLTFEYRHPFNEIVMRGRSFQSYVNEHDASIDDVHARIRHVMTVMEKHLISDDGGDA